MSQKLRLSLMYSDTRYENSLGANTLAYKDGSKSGGRKAGTPNRSTSARQVAMAKVNKALNELGEDSLSGMKLLQQVIRSPDCPLDVRITCSGLLLKHEMPLANEQKYVAEMPPPLPGKDSHQQVALWWALYGDMPAGNDAEWDNAVKVILEKAATKKPPGSLQ
jgi:hypothetical protein